MEKIQLTQEQAEIVEIKKNRKDKSSAIEHHVKIGWAGQKYRFLNDFTVDEFCRLLYVPGSYEVIAQYRVGEWVNYDNGMVSNPRYITNLISEVDDHYVYFDEIKCMPISQVRLATPEEIQQEKKRRFWDRIGRKEDEYRDDDLVVTKWGDFGFIDMREEDICAINRYPVILLKDSSIACVPADELRLVVRPEDRLDK